MASGRVATDFENIINAGKLRSYCLNASPCIFDPVLTICQGRDRKKNEALAARIFNRDRRASGGPRARGGGSLASRAGVNKVSNHIPPSNPFLFFLQNSIVTNETDDPHLLYSASYPPPPALAEASSREPPQATSTANGRTTSTTGTLRPPRPAPPRGRARSPAASPGPAPHQPPAPGGSSSSSSAEPSRCRGP